jgi:NAD(P)-dependent dehydrogenase (short-subunit alcohol dehydrogenase family)
VDSVGRVDSANVAAPLIITGGAQGIGFAVASRAVAAGVAVALLDSDKRELDRAVTELEGEHTLAVACDVSNERSINDAFAKVVGEWGPPGGVVASAGIERIGRIDEIDAELWDEVIRVNLRGVFLTCRAALWAMVPAGAGSIVCVSSPSSRVAIPGAGAYGASKAGVSALVRVLALDHARDGVRVNAIIPGATETRLMWGNVAPGDQDQVRAQLAQQIPAGRLAEPSEPAEAILWLLSEAASYVTGAELVCDGGLLARASISV